MSREQKESLLLSAAQESDEWTGWCTVESEPAIFNQLLWDIGVQAAQIHEIYSLDLDSFSAIKPVHGLIFLFNWRKEVNEEEVEISCPENVWFANQVVDNACASLALLNIVLNTTDLDIGEHLSQFREFTKDFSPSLRGLALTNFSFLQDLHNSLSRKSERAELDIALMEAATTKRKGGGKVKDEEEEAFHFIAYVPVDGVVWELDGMRRQPVRLGEFKGEWVQVATPRIQERIERYSAEEIRFNLLAVGQRPLPLLQTQLTDLTTLSSQLEIHLSALIPDWRVLIESIPATDADVHITSTLLSTAIQRNNLQELLSMKKALDRDMALLKMRIADEEQKISEYMDYVTRRRKDYSAFIRCMLEKLAERDLIRPYIS